MSRLVASMQLQLRHRYYLRQPQCQHYQQQHHHIHHIPARFGAVLLGERQDSQSLSTLISHRNFNSKPATDDREQSLYNTSGGFRPRDIELDCKASAIKLASRPEPNAAVETSHFVHERVNLQDVAFDGRIPHDMILTKTLYLSLDPCMRRRFDESTCDEVTDSYQIGQPIESAGIGVVVSCGNSVSEFQVGDLVLTGAWPWQSDLLQKSEKLTKIPQSLNLLIPITNLLGDVGSTGLAAHSLMRLVESCGPDDVVVISNGVGAVGLVAAQLAKHTGATVIGICVSDKEADVMKSVGCDATVNCNACDDTHSELNRCLKETGHTSASIYFDGVGGELSESVFRSLRKDAKIVVCDTVSNHAAPTGQKLPDADGRTALVDLCFLRSTSKLAGLETIFTGFENAPEAFVSMMNGDSGVVGNTDVVVGGGGGDDDGGGGGGDGSVVVKCGDLPLSFQVSNFVREALPPTVRGALCKMFVNENLFKRDKRDV